MFPKGHRRISAVMPQLAFGSWPFGECRQPADVMRHESLKDHRFPVLVHRKLGEPHE
jgi:hypothetical protein